MEGQAAAAAVYDCFVDEDSTITRSTVRRTTVLSLSPLSCLVDYPELTRLLTEEDKCFEADSARNHATNSTGQPNATTSSTLDREYCTYLDPSSQKRWIALYYRSYELRVTTLPSHSY